MSTSRPRAAIILAAGQGVRMRSAVPKPLHEIGGRAMMDWVVALADEIGCTRKVIVVPPGGGALAQRAAAVASVAVQETQQGTAHATLAARDALTDFDGDLIVMFGDTPLVQRETVEKAFAALREGVDVAVLGFEAIDPAPYGRLVRDASGGLERIVEAKDCSPEQLKIKLSNSGVMAGDAKLMFALMAEVDNKNAKSEYYLTQIVERARARGKRAGIVTGPEEEFLGINSRAELAKAEAAFQERMRDAALVAGVTMIDPSTVYFSHDTKIAQDVTIEPNVVFGLGVSVARSVHIHAFCHFEQATIGEDCELGPFARLRPGAQLSAHVKIGNFVEVKNSTIGEGTKASHLTYLGDATIGAGANIGAGTITCNYDGFDKNRTEIGDEAFIGSNSALVAPVRIGARVYIAAGSTITTDVADDELGIGRGKQDNKPGWASEFRARKLAERAEKPK